jgi:tetratricopeptide (TPR) repeat protein
MYDVPRWRGLGGGLTVILFGIVEKELRVILKFKKTTMIKRFLLLILVIIPVIAAQSQTPPEEFFKGLDLMSSDLKEAKKEFTIALHKDSLFHGTYHFLGVISIREGQYDSAIYYFKKTILLNTANERHTREMAYDRLIHAFLYKYDFKDAFDAAREAFLKYPENKVFSRDLRDVCLWSYHIRHNGLDSSYLSPQLKKEYIVNSVDQEYLIVRIIRIDDNGLSVQSQSLRKIKRNNYDILTCAYLQNTETIDLNFRINWDMDKYYGGKTGDPQGVYANAGNPVYVRIGALQIANDDIDLEEEIEKITGN